MGWGRFAGGVINFSTKSGTNVLHGTAYEFLRNKVLNPNTFLGNAGGLDRPPFVQNQFGANAGGPLFIPHVYDRPLVGREFLGSEDRLGGANTAI